MKTSCYMVPVSLLQFEEDVMPFTFADVLILRYLFGSADERQTVKDFNAVNAASDLNWSFKSQIAKFIKRFWKEPYKDADRKWMQELVKDNQIRVKSKFGALNRAIE